MDMLKFRKVFTTECLAYAQCLNIRLHSYKESLDLRLIRQVLTGRSQN